jgi:hypothetical protein
VKPCKQASQNLTRHLGHPKKQTAFCEFEESGPQRAERSTAGTGVNMLSSTQNCFISERVAKFIEWVNMRWSVDSHGAL